MKGNHLKKKKVNATEIARLAGVSQSTVSRVFNSSKPVSEDLRSRVMDIAEMLEYRPNALARGLTMNKTNMIGLVMGDVENPFFSGILEKMTSALKKRGFKILFVHTKEGVIQEEEISQFMEYNVDGVIVTDALLTSNIVRQLSNNEIPVVLFYRDTKDSSCHFVGCDNYSAGRKIGEFLYNQGHRQLAYITGHKDSSTNQERQEGFCTFLREKGITPIIEMGGYSYESGYHAALKLFSKNNLLDAIFCADDIMAIGVIDAAQSLGINIPQDLSIVGFDDIPMASWSPYSLTTWKVPVDEMVELTISILLKEINQETEEMEDTKHILLPGTFIERKSVISNLKPL
ncbi:LacI family DNA-binding transcriptional regulator [Priestia aryabhattai]|uniref:LacI family DNA-binding transcriptional regulator n=1 Tax=Priestia aryabhattai TaxID=412384 RepID=UPI002040A2D3|nr:LacI family DNA-binding transcriptional regulator [Priestia aryabhattai]MCM3255468.1 LacI family DNA-binding transcriptional regulator [Priestia aryabhattai]